MSSSSCSSGVSISPSRFIMGISSPFELLLMLSTSSRTKFNQVFYCVLKFLVNYLTCVNYLCMLIQMFLHSYYSLKLFEGIYFSPSIKLLLNLIFVRFLTWLVISLGFCCLSNNDQVSVPLLHNHVSKTHLKNLKNDENTDLVCCSSILSP